MPSIPPRSTQFTSEYQPTSDQKKEGWKKRKFRQTLLNDILKQSSNGINNYDALISVLSLPLNLQSLTPEKNLIIQRAWDIVTNLSPKELNITGNNRDKIEVHLGSTPQTQGELEL
ncbi:MAG: hypothetical protein LBD98_03230 [Endomicrobium sp.]|jgi:hypothetical protein|nr:hypothetical protein [Endomicrobium sp.]